MAGNHLSGKNAQEIGGEWEIDYPAWEDVWDAFCQVLTDFKAGQAEERLLAEMLYLIARDNEGEGLIQRTARHPAWFEALCRCAVRSPEPEARWQFAAYLPECPCSREVKDLILDFAKDSHEYVNRRALLAMPALRPRCVEQFAPLFWERTAIPLNCRNTSGSPSWFPWTPFTPTCCPDIWSWPDRTGGSICWNTQRGLWLRTVSQSLKN